MKSNRTLLGSLAIALVVLALLGGKVVQDIATSQREVGGALAGGLLGAGGLGAGDGSGDAAKAEITGVVLREAGAGASAGGVDAATGGYWDAGRGAVRFRIAGEVFDAASGRPVQAFEIMLTPASRASQGLSRQVSEANGQFVVEGLAAGAWELTVRASGYAPSRQSVVLSAPTDDPYVVFPLSSGARLTGVVVDWRDDPVEGATIAIGEVTTKSDAKGAFILKSAPEDTAFTLTATHPRYGTAILPNLRVAEGETEHVRVSLSGILKVTGHVYRGAERAPVTGVMVKSGDATTATDERGVYEIFIPLGEHPMVRVVTGTPPVELESYPDNRSAEPLRWVTARTHVAELTKDFFLAMETGRLVGRISEANGAPVVGAHVLINNTMGWAKRDHQTFPAETTTDADGRYRVDNLPAHAGYRLRLRRDSEERLLGTVTMEEPAEVEANFVLAGSTLRGRFIDAKSKNAFAMSVRDCDSVGATRIGDGAIHVPKCFDDATFEIADLADGRYRIAIVGAKVHGNLKVHELEVDVPARSVVDVEIEGEQSRTWTARITDTSGSFVAGGMLRYVTGKSLVTGSLEVGDEGTTRFTVAASQPTVFIEAPGYAASEIALAERDPRNVIDVRLARATQ
ncbi:MAG: carboxypeptidase-like regulatory domain-containing protein [Myxococcota bacterium]